MGLGAPPQGGWAMGMVELMVTDHPASRRFWIDVMALPWPSSARRKSSLVCSTRTGRR